MSLPSDASRLINRHLDGVMNESEAARLAELMLEDAAVIDLYMDLMQVHGQMTWGAAANLTEPIKPALGTTTGGADHIHAVAAVADDREPSGNWRFGARHVAWTGTGLVALLLLALVGVLQFGDPDRSPEETTAAVDVERVASDQVRDVEEESAPDAVLEPLHLDRLDQQEDQATLTHQSGSANREALLSMDGRQQMRWGEDLTDQQVVSVINELISTGLRENGMQPSPAATSEEWVRRAWLTIAGHIPSLEEMRLVSEREVSARDRSELIERLVSSPARHNRLAEVWTCLLVGRAERPFVNRGALDGYLRSAFEDNRPWIDIVGELVSAEGRADENGATNFLLAHLDNQATPATAVTARLFLGEQLQCVQCHDHPFVTDIRQHEYWAFNAFFQNTSRKIGEPGSAAGMQRQTPKLVESIASGMTYFETLKGRQEAVVAAYDGKKIAADAEVPRRSVLAEFLKSDSQFRVARSMVNRMWADFFGYGFTSPVDDMGPHTVVSHPELLDTLTSAFVASGYDLQRLQKWIAMSDAWQCSSRVTAANEDDAPEAGTVPLFSRVYVRRMAPEQVYDSIRVAIRAVGRQQAPAGSESSHRTQWVNQFSRPYDTDENDETDEFNGSVTQALVMMNGPGINSAIQQASQAFLSSVSRSMSADNVLTQISLAVLSRSPTSGESEVFRRHLNRLRRGSSLQETLPRVTEDMLWAYLNSSEFLLIH